MSGGFSKAGLERLHGTMVGYAERGEVPGLVALLARGDAVHVETAGALELGGSAPMRRDTLFRIASMTKPIAAVAALILVEECVLRLDEPIARWLPELASPRVLRRIDGPVDDTVPAARPITLRDLLTFRLGTGMLLAPPGTYPIQKALAEAGLAPGPDQPTVSPDEWLRRLATQPLLYQPGEKWLYHTGSDLLGVLIARASGRSFGDFLRAWVFEPLGMRDTGFHVPAEKLARLTSCYVRNPVTHALELYDDAKASRFAQPPVFESGGGGLVSTADDYLAFCRMLLNGGRDGHERVLSRASVELMTTDQLTDVQRHEARFLLGENRGWGFGVSVVTRRDDLCATPGRFGWEGGYGTSAHSDPEKELVGMLLTQRLFDSPEPPPVLLDFWTCTYGALDD